MNLRGMLSWRGAVLGLLWLLPIITCIVLGGIALYRSGWLLTVTWLFPVAWLLAWIVSKLWRAPKLGRMANTAPLRGAAYWTARDTAAIEIVDAYRREVADFDRSLVTDHQRYISDARAIAQRLAVHYHQRSESRAWHRLTLIEILTVIHLAVEDLEAWTLKNLPGSNLATLDHFNRASQVWKWIRVGQTTGYFASTLANPAKLLTYPLWRQAGRVGMEMQDQAARVFYQAYLRNVGYYLIEMYSGRLKGGSQQYREHFTKLNQAMHAAGGDRQRVAELQEVSTTITVLGQVKAGKSSLINALLQDKAAETSILPETRKVQTYRFTLPESHCTLELLDTPGYGEADLSHQYLKEIRQAAERADIILLVMAANSAARQSDVEAVQELRRYYSQHPQLHEPAFIAVLSHIDRLRPVREWSPPYDWKFPKSDKARSIAKAVGYTDELFGESINSIVCVYTGDEHPRTFGVGEELVPAIIKHLDQGHAAAVLRAFYQSMSRERVEQLTAQLSGLLKSFGRALLTATD